MSHHDLIELNYGPVVPLLSKAIRAQFVAPKGKVFYGGDFTNIEGRINAWFAGEDWKLAAYRAYDGGGAADLYKLAVSRTFGIAVDEVTRAQRQSVGKVQELAFGYQGSVGAWLRFDQRPDAVVRITKERFAGLEPWRKAAGQYDRSRHHFDLTPDQWIAIKVNVNLWREANAKITASWWELQDAALMAVEAPGTKVTALSERVAYMVDDGFLWCQLPSGKLLAYARPRLVEMKEEWLVDAEGEAVSIDELLPDEIAAAVAAGGKIETGRTRTQVAFDGKNQKTGRWGRIYLYGGLQCNNIVQSTARELLRFAMLNIERAGYPIVLHVHDETVSEVDEMESYEFMKQQWARTPGFSDEFIEKELAKGLRSVAEYQALMSILPPWLEGLPLAAKAWTYRRYIK